MQKEYKINDKENKTDNYNFIPKSINFTDPEIQNKFRDKLLNNISEIPMPSTPRLINHAMN